MSFTPIQFADAVRDQFFQPAVDELAGRDNRLQLSEAGRAPQLPGNLSLVGGELDRYFRVTG